MLWRSCLFSLLLLSTTLSYGIEVIGIFPVFTQIAQDLAPDHIECRSLYPLAQDPHYISFHPQQIMEIHQADLVLGPVEIIHKLRKHNPQALAIDSLVFCQETEMRDIEANFFFLIHEKKMPLSLSPAQKQAMLASLTHEWLSFDGIVALFTVVKDKLIELCPEHIEEIHQKYFTIIQRIYSIKKKYLNKIIEKKSIFYHHDFWILEEELHQEFGPALYSCDDNALSPEDKVLLGADSAHYAAFFVDGHMNLASLSKLTQHLLCPIRKIYPLGQKNSDTVSWLDHHLAMIFNPTTEG